MAFIDLTNVEIADEVSENAKMLVEDDGEIKRTAMPSGGGEQYDIIIKGWYGTISGTSQTGFFDKTFVGELPEETISSMLINKIRAGEIIKGKVIITDESMDNIISVCPIYNVYVENDVNVELRFFHKNSSITLYVEGNLIS